MWIKQPDRPFSQPRGGKTQRGHAAARRERNRTWGGKRGSPRSPHKARMECHPLLPLGGYPPSSMASFSSSLSSSPSVKATDPPRGRYTLGPADSKTEEYGKEEKRRQTLIKHLLRAGLMLETFAWTIFLIPQNKQALLFLIFSRLRNLHSCQWGWGWHSRGGGV